VLANEARHYFMQTWAKDDALTDEALTLAKVRCAAERLRNLQRRRLWE
jgi:hypothetical protein